MIIRNLDADLHRYDEIEEDFKFDFPFPFPPFPFPLSPVFLD